MQKIKGVVDVDDFVEAPHQQLHFKLDRKQAALNGISVGQVASTLRLALDCDKAGSVHIATERRPLFIQIQLARAKRSSAGNLMALRVKTDPSQ